MGYKHPSASCSAVSLIRACKFLGMTRRGLSEFLGISESTVYRYMAGDKPIPYLVECVLEFAVCMESVSRRGDTPGPRWHFQGLDRALGLAHQLEARSFLDRSASLDS